MLNPRLSRIALSGVALTLTVTGGGIALQPGAAHAETASTTATASGAQVVTITKVTKVTKAAKAKSAKQARTARQQARAGKAIATARKQLGDPYRYGATGPGSFDCSGLVQFSWKKAGVSIPRVTHSQFARIRTKVSWNNLKPGDLMFFYGRGHVGMYVGNGKMIHSPSTGKTVRIEKLSGSRKASFNGAVRPGL